MRITSLPLFRAALALALLVVISSAFAVVRADPDASTPSGGSDAGVVAREATTTSTPTAVGLVSGELAAQGHATSIVSADESAPVAFANPAAAGLPRLASSPVTTSTQPATTTTTIAPSTTTTTAPPATTAPPTTSAPATTVPETTTTTVVVTTTTTAPPETTPTTSPPSGGVLSEAEARSMFALYFSAGDVDKAISVAICESGLNTAAYNPAGYGGLFQHSIVYWPDRAAAAGWAGASIYDGNANAAVSAWLVNTDGWHHWPNC